MVDYPVSFSSEVKAEKEEEGWRLETEEGLETSMSTPEEFGGDSENPSPEDLFNASLGSCIIATFKITAERKGLEFGELEVKSSTDLDRNDEGRPVMKESEVTVKVKGVKDEELADEVADAAERNCFIHNSVETQIDMDFKFR